jgi:predicted AAA+ superfamily ATPase
MPEYINALRKYNYWDGESIKTGYLRENYLRKVKKTLGTPLVKVLVGQRRTGKSYLLRQIILLLHDQGVNPENVCYLNKEMFEFNTVMEGNDLFGLVEEYRRQLKPRGRIYLMLDEVQSISGWEKVVNAYAQNPKIDIEVFITGSNSTLLSGELATWLSGRYVSFTIFPFSFVEYAEFLDLKPNRETMIRYLKSGGMPELLHISDDEMKQHYIQSLRDTILLRDIVQRYHIKDAWLLENLFNYLVSQTGRLFSISNIVNYFHSQKIKTNHETMANYLQYLRQSFLIHEVPRYHIKAKEILSGVRKYYLNDVSFRNYAQLRMETGLSQNLENYIFLHFLMAGYTIYVGAMLNKEVDFIIEKGNQRQYIQATYLLAEPDIIKREFGNLEVINDHYPKKVISLDDASIGIRNGIEHTCAWNL